MAKMDYPRLIQFPMCKRRISKRRQKPSTVENTLLRVARTISLRSSTLVASFEYLEIDDARFALDQMAEPACCHVALSSTSLRSCK